MRTNSLAWRSAAASIVLLPLVLGFSAFMLERSFRASLYSAEQDQLLTHTYSMMALATVDEGFISLPENLTDSRFNDPASGLYGQVVDEEFGPIWQSISLTISPLFGKVPAAKVEMGKQVLNEVEIEDQGYFISRFDTVWEIDEQDREYQFVVIHSQGGFDAEVARYRRTLLGWLGGLAIILLIVQFLVIRWGLLPLGRLADEISQLESGKIERLDSPYPAEIVPVTQNINLLLSSEQQQRKRYKNTLGDLAHSLKTPLTVVRSLLNKPDGLDTKSIDEQIDRMSTIIAHQLNRASASKASFLSNLDIPPLVERLAQALEKVYHDKSLVIETALPASLHYPAQEDDMMEVLGNLMENACKYGQGRVRILADTQRELVNIHIEDDGPGVPEGRRETILERGARLDTHTPGQGIGLAVVVDIVASYDGSLAISQSALGGAKFTVSLPKV